jgi:hypothetical protein
MRFLAAIAKVIEAINASIPLMPTGIFIVSK